jgi:acetolactate synthase-1/2/3 large subunit
MEMASALLHQLKITVIVHAEESWTMEETCQLMDFGSPESVIGCDQPPIRWDRLAEGIGCHGEYVDRVEDLEAAVIRAKESDLPAVVCVKTDKQENLLPPFLNEFSEVYMGPMEG